MSKVLQRLLGVLILLVCLGVGAEARVKLQGFASQGNTITTAGIASTDKAVRVFPGATVTIYRAGTSTLVSLCSDNLSPCTSQANPFTADSAGYWSAYLDSGQEVDVRYSGTGIATPFTIGSITVLGNDDARFTTISATSYGVPADGTTDAYASLQALFNSEAARSVSTRRCILLPGVMILVSKPLLMPDSLCVLGDPAGTTRIKGTFGSGYTVVMKKSTGNITTGTSLVSGPGVAMKLGGALPWLNLITEGNTQLANTPILNISALSISFHEKRLTQVPNGVFFSYGSATSINGIGATRSVQLTESTTNGLTLYWGGTAHTSSNNILTLNTVEHVEVSYDGSTVRVFLNGVSVISFSYSGAIPGSPADNFAISREVVGIDGTVASLGAPDAYIDNFDISKVARHTSNFTAPTSKSTVANGGIDSNTLLHLNFDDRQGDWVVGTVGTRSSNAATAWFAVSGYESLQFTDARLEDVTIECDGYVRQSGLLNYGGVLARLEDIRVNTAVVGMALDGSTFGANLNRIHISASSYGFAQTTQSAGTVANQVNATAGAYAYYFNGSVGGSYTGSLMTPGSTTYGTLYVSGTNEVNFYHMEIDDEGQAPNLAAAVVISNANVKFFDGRLSFFADVAPIVLYNGGSIQIFGGTLYAGASAPQYMKFLSAPKVVSTIKGVIRANTGIPFSLTPQYLEYSSDTDRSFNSALINSSNKYTYKGNDLIRSQPQDVANPTGGATVDVEARAALVALLTQLRTAGFLQLTNLALASSGTTVTASSTIASLAASYTQDGELTGASSHYWNDNTASAFPDTLDYAFTGSKLVYEVDVVSAQNTISSLTTADIPDDTTTGTSYVISSFEIQWWDGAAWQTDSTITGNNLIIKRVVLATPRTTTKIRVKINGSQDGVYSRVTEVQIYGRAP